LGKKSERGEEYQRVFFGFLRGAPLLRGESSGQKISLGIYAKLQAAFPLLDNPETMSMRKYR
jgi:hypothetical protein